MSFLVFVNSLVLIFAGVLMMLDAIVFPTTLATFLSAGFVSTVVGICMAISSSSDLEGFGRLHTFLLTASVWMTAAVVGALPLYLWGMDFTDAFFEAMSGITTTGSTVMIGLDHTDHGVLAWRAVLQWVGGVGFIVTGIALLPILRVGGMQLFRTESSERGEKELISAASFARATLWIYAAISGACFVVYLIGGMSVFDAFAHAATTISTGGYSTSDASFGMFESPFLQWSCTIFMLAGALPFAWYVRVVNRRLLRSEQVRALLWGLATAIAVLTVWRVLTSDVEVFVALREVAFNVVSVVTTTGFATTDYTLWGHLPVAFFFLLTALGGCTGSTAGGGKTMRWLILARCIGAQIRRLHQPHGVFLVKYEGRTVRPDELDGIIAFFSMYFATFTLLASLLTMMGQDVETATSGALTALTNVGPGIGPIIGPAGNFSSLSDPSKWALALGMYLGRLELLTVFVLLVPGFWREVMPARRRSVAPRPGAMSEDEVAPGRS